MSSSHQDQRYSRDNQSSQSSGGGGEVREQQQMPQQQGGMGSFFAYPQAQQGYGQGQMPMFFMPMPVPMGQQAAGAGLNWGMMMPQGAMMPPLQPWQQMGGMAQGQAQSGGSHQPMEVDGEARASRPREGSSPPAEGRRKVQYNREVPWGSPRERSQEDRRSSRRGPPEGSHRETRQRSPERETTQDKGKGKEWMTERDQWRDEPHAEALWRCLLQAGHHVPPETEFLRDTVAQVVVTGLLDKIALLQERQHNTIATFNKALKHRAATPKSALESEPKRTRADRPRAEDSARPREGQVTGVLPLEQRIERESGPSTSLELSRQGSVRSAISSTQVPKRKERAVKQVDEFLVQMVTFAADVPQGVLGGVLRFQPPVEYEPPADSYPEKWLDANPRTENEAENVVPLGAPMVVAEEVMVAYPHGDSEDEDANYISSNEATPDEEESKHERGVRVARNMKKNKRRKNEQAEFERNKQRRAEEATGIIPPSLGV